MLAITLTIKEIFIYSSWSRTDIVQIITNRKTPFDYLEDKNQKLALQFETPKGKAIEFVKNFLNSLAIQNQPLKIKQVIEHQGKPAERKTFSYRPWKKDIFEIKRRKQ